MSERGKAKPAPAVQRRQPRRLPGSQDHRVTMRPEVYEVASRLASREGVTVAYWLTRLVEREAAKGG